MTWVVEVERYSILILVAAGLVGVPACDSELTPVDPQEFCDRVLLYEEGEPTDVFLRCDLCCDDAIAAGCSDLGNGVWVSREAFTRAETDCETRPGLSPTQGYLVQGGTTNMIEGCVDAEFQQAKVRDDCYW